MIDETLVRLSRIASLKDHGYDCTEDDSAFIKRFFDISPAFDPLAQRIARLFPAEFSEWGEEVESGQRIWTYREENKP